MNDNQRRPLPLWFGLWFGYVVIMGFADGYRTVSPGASSRGWLVTMGLASELTGVLLIASPELRPRLETASLSVWRAVRLGVRRLLAGIRHLLRRRAIKVIDAATATGRASATAAVSVVGAPKGLSGDELLDWLVKEHERVDKEVQQLGQAVRELPQRWRDDDERLRKDLTRQTRTAIAEVANAEVRMRLFGVLYVVVGLVLAWSAHRT